MLLHFRKLDFLLCHQYIFFAGLTLLQRVFTLSALSQLLQLVQLDLLHQRDLIDILNYNIVVARFLQITTYFSHTHWGNHDASFSIGGEREGGGGGRQNYTIQI